MRERSPPDLASFTGSVASKRKSGLISDTRKVALSAAIPDGQNFRQKLQPLAIIKIQISVHQKKTLSKLC